MLVKVANRLLILLICGALTGHLVAREKQKRQPKICKPAGPISRSEPAALYRSIITGITCPVCPNFICTGPTGGGGITGCTGPNCTGPCKPELTAQFCCLNITENVSIRGFLTVNTQTINGNILVGGNADFKSNLSVAGDGNLQGNSCMTRDLTVENNVNVGGFAVVLGSLTVDNALIVNGGLTQIGNQVVQGSLGVTGNQTIGGALFVGGPATFSGLLTANGAATGPIPASLQVFNGSIVNNGLSILNTGCTMPTGCTGAFIAGPVCIIGDAIINGSLTTEGQLTVDNNATFDGTFTTTGAFITNAVPTFNAGLTIASGGEIISAGNLNMPSDASILTIQDDTTFQGTVVSNNGLLVNGGMTVNNGMKLSLGNLEVTQGNMSVGGTLTVNGTITSAAGISSAKDVDVTSGTNALCSNGPAALIDNGGMGIAKDLWEGGCQYFNNASAELAGYTPTCFDYYEETCYATSFIWGGQPVTPATNVLVRVIRVGSIVNVLIPAIIINNPGTHIDVITSSTPLPARFRPTASVRGPASTVISNTAASVVSGELGEFDVSPSGVITIGIPGDAISPQLIISTNFVYADINTITFNLNQCSRVCKSCPT